MLEKERPADEVIIRVHPVVPVSATTALVGLRAARVEAGQTVLITGAGGGVGSYAVQLARAMGAEVTRTCAPVRSSSSSWSRQLASRDQSGSTSVVNAAFVVFVTLVFWGAVFMVFFTAQGTGPAEFFLGRLEPPPSDLGVWKESGAAAESHLVREERYLLPQNDSNASQLLHQVRYLDRVTRDIVRVETERRVRRRRVRAR